MSSRPVQELKLFVTIGLATVLLLAGCSNPLSGAETTPETTSGNPTATPAAPMPIVTPTPIDPTAVAAASNQTPGTGDRPATYVVAENDTLYAIAAQFDVDIARLVEENGLSDPNDIYVGQELAIPAAE